MRTQYIPNPPIPGNCLHNTGKWQVTELMGGLACELLQKTRSVSASDQGDLELHDCYPSIFMQGDAARDFLGELERAQARLPPREVDRLMLSAYEVVFQA